MTTILGTGVGPDQPDEAGILDTSVYIDFDPLPFDGDAAARYGTLVALTLSANRDLRPRRMDLMIAAIASSRGLPLYTRRGDDFRSVHSMITVIAV